MKKWLFILLFLFSGCAKPVYHLYPENESERPIPVYIISHGWHVGIAIESKHVKPFLPAHDRIPQATYLKFGWGDQLYYPNNDAGFWLMLRAALIPTRSVLHVVGINRPVEHYFPSSTIIEIKVSKQGADKLATYISDRFKRVDGRVKIAADGLYPNSLFFEATESYYFPKTSNKWTARALRETGYPITSFYAVTSGNVVRQAKKHGRVIQER